MKQRMPFLAEGYSPLSKNPSKGDHFFCLSATLPGLLVTNSVRRVLALPFDRQGNRGMERMNSLPMTNRLAGDRALAAPCLLPSKGCIYPKGFWNTQRGTITWTPYLFDILLYGEPVSWMPSSTLVGYNFFFGEKYPLNSHLLSMPCAWPGVC